MKIFRTGQIQGPRPSARPSGGAAASGWRYSGAAGYGSPRSFMYNMSLLGTETGNRNGHRIQERSIQEARNGLFTVRPDTAPIASGKPFPPFDMACTRTASAFPSGHDNRQRATRPGRRASAPNHSASARPCALRSAPGVKTTHSAFPGYIPTDFRDITRPPGPRPSARGPFHRRSRHLPIQRQRTNE